MKVYHLQQDYLYLILVSLSFNVCNIRVNLIETNLHFTYLISSEDSETLSYPLTLNRKKDFISPEVINDTLRPKICVKATQH